MAVAATREKPATTNLLSMFRIVIDQPRFEICTSQKLYQCLGGFLRSLLQHPVPSILQHHDRHVGPNQFHLLSQRFSQRLVTADAEHWHGEPGLGELSEILRGLQE